MGRLKNLHIAFNERQPFNPGQLLQGRVLFYLESPQTIKYGKLHVNGLSKVKWKVGSGDDEKTYKSKEHYISEDINLYGSSQQGFSLQAGQHQKGFQFRLPPNIPSSVLTKHGHIFYDITVTMRCVNSSEQHATEPLMIVNPINLHVDRPACQFFERPTRICGDETDSGCCGVSNDHVVFDFKTEKSAYNPGESIVINGFLFNDSSLSTERVEMSLIQIVTVYGKRHDFSFTSSGNVKSKLKSVTVAAWNGERAAPHEKIRYENRRTIRVPESAPESEVKHCNNIEIAYCIQFSVCLNGSCSLTLKSQLQDIFIGNGVTEPSAPFLPTAPEEITMTEFRDGSIPTAPPPPMTSLPPSYESVVNSSSAPGPTSEQPLPPYSSIHAFDKTTGPPEGGDAAPSQTQYYDWSQTAFTYN